MLDCSAGTSKAVLSVPGTARGKEEDLLLQCLLSSEGEKGHVNKNTWRLPGAVREGGLLRIREVSGELSSTGALRSTSCLGVELWGVNQAHILSCPSVIILFQFSKDAPSHFPGGNSSQMQSASL